MSSEMDLGKLLSEERRKDMHKSEAEKPRASLNTGAGRDERERDFDRVLFSAPTRRLADKTQVFPLDANDSVRTRLTHSYEVSNLSRSIGMRLVYEYFDEIFDDSTLHVDTIKRGVPAILATVGLAHDLGNPPFGHSGERSMCEWFKENLPNCHPDFLSFDGNAQTFRLLTHLQIQQDDFGLNLTCSTLASLLKYPSFANDKEAIIIDGKEEQRFHGYKKFGIFESEREAAEDVWKSTGLAVGVRHPLVYIMEACDDIAYSIIDAEDIIKKGYASYYDLLRYIENHSGDDAVCKQSLKEIEEKNREFSSEELSSSEISELSMQNFRVKAISVFVEAVIKAFVENKSDIFGLKQPTNFSLISASSAKVFCKQLKGFDKSYGFSHREVLALELDGEKRIKSVMTYFWDSINIEDYQRNAFQKYVYGSISENYRRIYSRSSMGEYNKCQLLCDAISGMTDTYITTLDDELRRLSET